MRDWCLPNGLLALIASPFLHCLSLLYTHTHTHTHTVFDAWQRPCDDVIALLLVPSTYRSIRTLVVERYVVHVVVGFNTTRLHLDSILIVGFNISRLHLDSILRIHLRRALL